MLRRRKDGSNKQQADLQERRTALQCQIRNWREAQVVYISYASTMLATKMDIEEAGMPQDEMAESVPLFLPSSLPLHIRSLRKMARVCLVEQRLRLAQAEDALVDIRRQRRIVQRLWHFKKINVSGTGNRPNTRMLTLYRRINLKIERATQRYCTACEALVILDPEGLWKDHLRVLRNKDIRGPGKDSNDTTTNGQFEPSWIWLVQTSQNQATQTEEDFDDSMRVE